MRDGQWIYELARDAGIDERPWLELSPDERAAWAELGRTSWDSYFSDDESVAMVTEAARDSAYDSAAWTAATLPA